MVLLRNSDKRHFQV